MSATVRSTHQLVGRDDVRRRIAVALAEAGGQGSRTVVIVGEAGIGKTWLARDAAEHVPDAIVFAGACLPLATISVPFLALRTLFRNPQVASAAPVVDFDAPAAQVLVELDRWVDATAVGSRIVLLIDDLQWADPATLDVLLYLMSRPGDARLTIIVTVRDGRVGASRDVDRWLANVRRMPGCDIVLLGPLDRAGTTDQLTQLLGVPPHQSLVEDVWRHAGGSPYLTALAAAGVDPQARRLPTPLPRGLEATVRDAVHALGEDVVALLRVLAVSGRPLAPGELAAVIAAGSLSVASDGAAMDSALATARAQGTIVRAPDGRDWFRHPLTAEVLEGGLSLEDRRSWHAAFVRVGGSLPAEGLTFEEVARLADHSAESGVDRDAFEWARTACRRAMTAGAYEQALRFAMRAWNLRPDLDDSPETERELLALRRTAAFHAGAVDAELEVIDRLLEDVGADDDLARAELVLRGILLRAAGQHGDPTAEELARAMAMTAGHPASWQRAQALAFVVFWTAEERPGVSTVEIVDLARRTGSDLALTWALVGGLLLAIRAGDLDTARRMGDEAVIAAIRAGDGLAHNTAADAVARATHGAGTQGFAEEMRSRRRAAAGRLPHGSWLAMLEAEAWFDVGRWDDCAAALRFIIGELPKRPVDVAGRVVAGRLAVRQGRFSDAAGHFARVEELVQEGGLTSPVEMKLGRAELRLEAGDPVGAAVLLATLAPTAFPEGRGGHEQLRRLVARALADAAEAGGSLSSAARVEDLIGRFLRGPRTAAHDRWECEVPPTLVAADQALLMAEAARAGHQEAAEHLWLEAIDLCAAADWPWETAYACRRAAESVLLSDRADRAAAAPLIRRGLDVADHLGAAPLARALRDLARYARIPVPDGDVDPTPEPTPDIPGIAGLTPRESEIVGLLVAGRTYREIASELFLSEKTVSSHISNILRKTGASNRIDLARRASGISHRSSV
ncbi:helix-turn-helix transcriptional regulator [Microbacterium sp. P5_E9]